MQLESRWIDVSPGSGADEDAADRSPTLLDMLRYRASHDGQRTAFVFLSFGRDDRPEQATLTFAGLEMRARAVAATLQARCEKGDRALILCAPGLDYIVAFYGCVMAGVVAVPAYPPRNSRHMDRLSTIVSDSDATAVLMTTSLLSRLQGWATDHPLSPSLIAVDAVDAERGDGWRPPDVGPDDLVFLQYTSGTTGSPKGVMVQNRQLTANVERIADVAKVDEASVVSLWLPPYHDMGLVDGVVLGVFAGSLGVLMSPLAFLQRPARWLKVLSHWRATHTIAPNFAFRLCVEQTAEADLPEIDLSALRLIHSGAELVRPDTMEAFAARFTSCGFHPERFRPAYGLAETVVLATASTGHERPLVVDRKELQAGRLVIRDRDEADVVRIASCGQPLSGHALRIVDPLTRRERAPGEIGEIWLSGPSVSLGYWRKPEATRETFEAALTCDLGGDGRRRFLRTGDLGAVVDGSLYVLGRLKEMVIVRGRNHYATDLEQTAGTSHPLLGTDRTIAFAVEEDDAERLVLVHELSREALRTLDAPRLAAAMRQAVRREHEIDVGAIAFVKPGALPRTTSGKLQRSKARDLYLVHSLAMVAEWLAEPQPTPLESRRELSPTEIETWIRGRLAEAIGVAPDEIARDHGLADLGLDSLKAVQLAHAVAERYGVALDPSELYDLATVAALARRLAGRDPGRVSERPQPGAVADQAIAIVGMACRFPGGADLDDFWTLLERGDEAIVDIPADRFDLAAWYDPDPAAPGKIYTRRAGLVAGIEQFDAGFFRIAPVEAMAMDPQQRLLLEVSVEAVEQAAIPLERLRGSRAGVYVGAGPNQHAARRHGSATTAIDAHAATGAAVSVIAGRVAYALGLEGPAMVIDTACSSSLVAIDQACDALRLGKADLVLAGGVNTVLGPEGMVATCRARMLSPEGRCKTFDARADGYVRGEGCGVVVLKRLADAERDGDRIWAVIRGSAVNQDGASAGLTAPSGPAQQRVIAEALERSGLLPSDIDYLEAHGTGTRLGDPIEVRAAAAAYGPGRAPTRPLLIGSVKTNIGHLEAAAGIAGVIKTVLALNRGVIPRHLNFEQPSPHIPWKILPVQVVAEATPWEAREGRPRRAAVSSFGFSGTNAHLIVESRGGPPATGVGGELVRVHRLLALSARSEAALRDSARRMSRWVADRGPADLADLAFTAGTGRSHFSARAGIVFTEQTELAASLAALAEGEAGRNVVQAVSRGAPRIGFLFTGQGSQWSGMGRELYEAEPVFRAVLDRCEALVGAVRGASLLSVLHGREDAAGSIDDTAWTQPCLFALQAALVELYRSVGVRPAVVMGHSVGELAAAYAAQALDLETGLRLALVRGALMSALPGGGSMVAVFAPAERVTRALAGFEHLSLAADNGAHQVVSGPEGDLLALSRQLGEEGVRVDRLVVSHAFHSALMDPMLDAFEQAAGRLAAGPPALPMVSNVTGTLLRPADTLDGAYWRLHARRPVRFVQGLEALGQRGVDLLLEIGPRPVLAPLAASAWTAGPPPRSIAALRPNRPETESFMLAIAHLYSAGADIDFAALHCGERRTRIAIPTYPFQRHVSGGPLAPVEAPSPRVAGSISSLIGHCIARALHMDEADVAHDKPLGDFGLDSLLAMEILGTLESRFAVKLPAAAIDGRSTIARLAREVEARLAEPKATGRKLASVDRMRDDARLDDDFPQPLAGDPAAGILGNVLVTGATGFLGRALCERLLAMGAGVVYCLVRANASLDELERDERVIRIEGDLTLPRFGLEPARYDALARRVDCVFHAAARVNWLLGYDDLAPLNVGGTREILRFAAHGRAKPLHVVSTLGVFPAGLADGQCIALESSAPMPNASRFENAYAQTKCVAEMLCEEARRRGLCVSIHRMDFLTGSVGGGVMPWRYIVPRAIAAAVQLGCVPDIPVLFDFLPVDVAAGSMVALAATPGAAGGTFHLLNSEPMTFRVVRDVLARRGFPVELVPYDTWLDRIEGASAGSLYPFLAFLRDPTPFIAGYERFRVDDTQTRALLAASAAEKPVAPPSPQAICGRIVDDLVREQRVPAPTWQSQAAVWGAEAKVAVERECERALAGGQRTMCAEVSGLGGGLACVSWRRLLRTREGAPLQFDGSAADGCTTDDVQRISLAGDDHETVGDLARRLDAPRSHVVVAALLASWWRVHNAPALPTRTYRVAIMMPASPLLGIGDGFDVRKVELSTRATLSSVVAGLRRPLPPSVDQPVDLLVACREDCDGAVGVGPASHIGVPGAPVIEIGWGARSTVIDLAAPVTTGGRALGKAVLSALAPILWSGGRQLDVPLAAASVVDEAERSVDSGASATTLDRSAVPQTVLQRIVRQADATPDAVAIEWHAGRLTYAGLVARTSMIAALLIARGVRAGSPVAVCLERTPDLVAALLACHWVGAPYVPLDFHDPPARRLERVAESGAVLVVTGGASDLDATGTAVAALHELALAPVCDMPVPMVAGHLAYIIFTSGSTGRPKGVAISQAALANLMLAMAQVVGFTARDSLLAVTTPTFDIAALELFLPLTAGGRVVLADRDAARDGRRLAALLEGHEISVMQATPATWQLLLDAGWVGRAGLKALCGGEALTPRLARPLVERVGQLWNVYGPTEATIWATAQPVDAALVEANGSRPALPLGQPLPGLEVAIFDDRLQPVPEGAVGELCLAGTGLADGYCNDPVLTADRFRARQLPGSSAERFYLTGDLVYRDRGALHFVGRRDSQIKVRGYRIEPGEIEMQLCACAGIAQAAVVLQPNRDDDASLVAYVVAVAPIEAPAVRSWLETRLPAFMVPARIVQLARLPLSANGKVDRRALPWPVADTELDSRWTPPRTETERRLCAIWRELLGTDSVGVHDSFFDLQGHSLVAARMFSRIAEEFSVELPVRTLSQAQTVAELAALVDAMAAGEPIAIGRDDRLGRLRDDAVLAQRIRPARASRPRGTGVLLTGATGFLGRHLLLELLASTDAAVHCLVRSRGSSAAAKERLVQSLAVAGEWRVEWTKRLSVEPCDLGLDGLGLDAGSVARLQREIGSIFHAAAHVSFTLPYRNLAPVNVGATAWLLELACQGPAKRFHHVSTLSVFDQPSLFDGRVIEETAIPELVDEPLTGYAASKWVAERLVLEARQRGLDATIHRPGTICGDTRTGRWPVGELVPAFIEGCIQLGAVPDLESGLVLTPVDTVARAIVRASRETASSGGTFHPVAGEALALETVGGWLRQLGFEVEKLRYADWQARLRWALKRGDDNAIGAHSAIFLDEAGVGASRTVPELLVADRRPRYRNDMAAALVADGSLDGCAVDRALFEKYVQAWRDDGRLAPPRA